MCAGLSRRVLCGPGKTSDQKHRLFRFLVEQIETNLAIMASGKTFQELAKAAWPAPRSFMDLRYDSLQLGVDLCDENFRVGDLELFDA